MTTSRAKPAPVPTPETAPYWAAANERRLLVRRCEACDTAFAPMVMRCDRCDGALTWTEASGRARLASYVIVHRPAPAWRDEAPYVIALVDLDEGPRLMTNLLGVEPTPESLQLDAPYVVGFEPRGDDGEQLVPVFRPEGR